MYFREKIQKLVDNFHFYNRMGEEIDSKLAKKEYIAIKNYILKNYSSKDDKIAITLTKDYRYLLVIFACMEIGVTYIPMHNDYPQSRIEQIKEDSNFTFLISDNNIDEIINSNTTTNTTLKELDKNDILYILFTSGSTGKPKGVLIQRKAARNFFEWIDSYLSHFNKDTRVLQITRFTFDISLIDIALVLTKQLKLYFSDFEHDAFRFAYELQSYKINFINTVPNNLNMLLNDLIISRTDISSLKDAFIAGQRFSYGLYKKCLKHFKNKQTNIYNGYGPTESTIYYHIKKLTFNEESDFKNNTISIGKTLTNIKAMIYKDNQKLPPYKSGELLLGGAGLMKGYINNPSKTKEVLITIDNELWYKTGDIAFCDENGEYYVTGRLDDTIKVRGFRIDLLDIDSYIHKLDYIDDCTTVAIEDEMNENTTIAFMKLRVKKNIKELREDLKNILLDYQIPEKIVFVDKYPTNNSGKIDKRALKEGFINNTYKEEK